MAILGLRPALPCLAFYDIDFHPPAGIAQARRALSHCNFRASPGFALPYQRALNYIANWERAFWIASKPEFSMRIIGGLLPASHLI